MRFKDIVFMSDRRLCDCWVTWVIKKLQNS
jgi:hypothetical protein